MTGNGLHWAFPVIVKDRVIRYEKNSLDTDSASDMYFRMGARGDDTSQNIRARQ